MLQFTGLVWVGGNGSARFEEVGFSNCGRGRRRGRRCLRGWKWGANLVFGRSWFGLVWWWGLDGNGTLRGRKGEAMGYC